MSLTISSASLIAGKNILRRDPHPPRQQRGHHRQQQQDRQYKDQ
jgi:hypothetical protein